MNKSLTLGIVIAGVGLISTTYFGCKYALGDSTIHGQLSVLAEQSGGVGIAPPAIAVLAVALGGWLMFVGSRRP